MRLNHGKILSLTNVINNLNILHSNICVALTAGLVELSGAVEYSQSCSEDARLMRL